MPKFLDPLINVLFNNPRLDEYPQIASIVDKIAGTPQNYVIIVPAAHKFKFEVDKYSRKRFEDLCWEPSFIESHIVDLRTIESVDRHKIFYTINHKRLILQQDKILVESNGLILRSSEILNQQLLRSVATYLPFGSIFNICTVDFPLFGFVPIGSDDTDADDNYFHPQYRSISIIPADAQIATSHVFDDLMKNSTQLTALLGPKFHTLFHDLDFAHASDQIGLKAMFASAIGKGSEIFRSLPRAIYSDIVRKADQSMLKQGIYDYVEMNMHDKFWLQFTNLYGSQTDTFLNENYPKLGYLSITQIGLPDSIQKQPFANKLLLRIVGQAASKLKELNFSTTSSSRLGIFVETLEVLSQNTNSTHVSIQMDADNLLSLLILTIAYSGVQHLHCHLMYVKMISFQPEHSLEGRHGYTLSTFEAALSFLGTATVANRIIFSCDQNLKFWKLICPEITDEETQNVDTSFNSNRLKKLESCLSSIDAKNINGDHFIRSINSLGESCLMMAVRNGDYRVFKILTDCVVIFDLDFILEDSDMSGFTLLHSALITRNPEILKTLVEIIIEAEEWEVESYCSAVNKLGQNVGHLLMYFGELIPKLGPFINWRQMDIHKQTPLFAIVRYYDHPDYFGLLSKVFPIVLKWYRTKKIPFDYKDHMDGKRNSLIHSIRDGESLSMFIDTFKHVDINSINTQNLTPLMQSIKYMRATNVQRLLLDPRIEILKRDSNLFLSALDYLKFPAVHQLLDRANSSLPNVDNPSQSSKVKFEITKLVCSSLSSTYHPTGAKKSATLIRTKLGADKGFLVYLSCCSLVNTFESRLDRIAVHNDIDLIKILKALKLKRASDFPQLINSYLFNLSESIPSVDFHHASKLWVDFSLMQKNILLSALTFKQNFQMDGELWDYISLTKKFKEQTFLKKNFLAPDTSDFPKFSVIDVRNSKDFLGYLLEELSTFQSSSMNFYKINAFLYQLNIEAYQVNAVSAQLYARLARLDTKYSSRDPDFFEDLILTNFSKCSAEMKSLDNESSSDIFLESLAFLSTTNQEMMNDVDMFLSGKIQEWRKVYTRLQQEHQRLKRFLGCQSEFRDRNPQIFDSLSDLEIQFKNLLGHSYHFEYHTSTADGLHQLGRIQYPEQASNLLSNFPPLKNKIDNRRLAQADKFVSDFEHLKKQFCLLSSQLKSDYESICVKVSNYYLFKKTFTKFIFKKYAQERMKNLKKQNDRLKLLFNKFKSNTYQS
ncbi:hypothetical protein OGAPHI_000169 [Ogataea philodendri]|uniref:VPS9 domain-containing protein n=1 Tax=Ogataea philodendri TaxID=1378263 RepID=A0A9P8PGQ5_9ASCO|nr:uncharacterized protein OGAPHI_000169 [Ogataea philodendri]KAH3671983.1 hypothetical protein OGAPHI_000169 [Ogataea philodendri]